jgi:hypothetical protein
VTPLTYGSQISPATFQSKPGNPGRPKGSRNKLGEAFIQALAEDFERHGAEAIEAGQGREAGSL